MCRSSVRDSTRRAIAGDTNGACRGEGRHAARKTPLSCGNRPGTNRRKEPKKQPKEHYTVASYRRAIHRACELAFPPPPELARQRITPGEQGGSKQMRWETEQEWQDRLDDRWAELKAWRTQHQWSPHRLRKNAATRIRKEFGVELAKVILGHHSIAVTELYAQRDTEQAQKVIEAIG